MSPPFTHSITKNNLGGREGEKEVREGGEKGGGKEGGMKGGMYRKRVGGRRERKRGGGVEMDSHIRSLLNNSL